MAKIYDITATTLYNTKVDNDKNLHCQNVKEKNEEKTKKVCHTKVHFGLTKIHNVS